MHVVQSRPVDNGRQGDWATTGISSGPVVYPLGSVSWMGCVEDIYLQVVCRCLLDVFSDSWASRQA